MGGVAKTFKSVIKKPANIFQPVFSLPARGIQKLTGMSPLDQLKAGAGIGSGISALRSLGFFNRGASSLGGGAGNAGGNDFSFTGSGGPANSFTGAGPLGGPAGTTGSEARAGFLRNLAGGINGNNLAGFAGLGLLGAGLFGGRGPEIDEAINAGEAERAQQIINELADQQEIRRKKFLEETEATLKARRAETASSLSKRLAEQSRLGLPSLLEDLNSRGQFTSESAVANALAREQAQNTLQVQQFEQQQSIQDSDLLQSIASDILESRADLEQEGLSRRFGLEDRNAETRIASALAKRRAAADRNQAFVQTGTSLLTPFILSRLLRT